MLSRLFVAALLLNQCLLQLMQPVDFLRQVSDARHIDLRRLTVELIDEQSQSLIFLSDCREAFAGCFSTLLFQLLPSPKRFVLFLQRLFETIIGAALLQCRC